MAISFKRYVDITSGVGGGAAVRQRDLIGRVFTTNELVPTDSFIEFDTAAEVATYFGSTSEEYKRAVFYFGWISKNTSAPKKISFARWTDANTAAKIFSVVKTQAVGSYTSITAGTFTLEIGGVSNVIGPINFSSAASLADVAALVQTAIRAESGTQFTAATFTYDATLGRFKLVSGSAVAATISTAAGTGGSDIGEQLGILNGAIFSDGKLAETITALLTASAGASDNFGSFVFQDDLSDAEVLEAAQWNDTQNNKFIFCVPTDAANAAGYFDDLAGLSGVAVTLSITANEYPEMVPMIILAATNYSKRNAVQNYMFQVFDLTPSVTTDADANTYDPLRVNYYGRTQSAGQFIDFYQRGTMMGLATDAVDQNTYANEIWLKDAAGAKILELLLALSRVSANDTGKIQLQGILQSVIDQALLNGTISVGKTLTTTQKLYIAQITGDDLAWHQIQGSGWWLDVSFQTITTVDDRVEYKAVYSLLYSKDDAIRKVEGTHTLI